MIIKKIELENIKTHKKTVIPFKKGLNVLHGNNGTGKSTVLEMIGFVLFDYLMSTNHKDYIRDIKDDKAEHGTIRIWIIGLNEEPYIIERTIGKTGVMVYNGFTNKKLGGVGSIGKYKNWITQQLGLNSGTDLGTLFYTAIGIPQGMIIANFLDPPKKRKDYFDAILQLEIYEKLWKNLGFLKKNFEPDINVLKEEIRENIGEIKDKEDTIQKKKIISDKINRITLKLTESQEKANKVEENLKKIKKIKDQIESAKKILNELEIRQESEVESLKKLKSQMEESNKAKKICEETKKAYDIFLTLSQEYNALLDKNDQLNSIKDKLNIINEKYIEINSKIEQFNDEIKKAKESKEDLKKLEPQYNQYKKFDEDIKKLSEELAKIETQEENLRKKQKNHLEIGEKIKSLQEELKELKDWEQKYEKILSLEQEKNNSELEIARLTNEILFYQNNQIKLNSGICPFLDQQCKNFQEGTFKTDSLNDDIKEKQSKIDSKNIELSKIQKKLTLKDDIESKLTHLRNLSIKLAEFKKSFEAEKKEIEELKEIIQDKKSLQQAKELLETQKDSLETSVEDFLIKRTQVNKISEFETNRKEFQNNIQDIEKEKSNFIKIINKMGDIPEEIKKIKNKMNNFQEKYDLYLQNIKNAEKVALREMDVKTKSEELVKYKQDIKQINEKIQELTSNFDEGEYLKYEKENKEFNDAIAIFKTKIKEKTKRLEEINQKIKKIKEIEIKLEEKIKEKNNLEAQAYLIAKIRNWLRDFIPKMRKALISKINNIASEIYRSIRENVDAVLEWNEDYEITISTSKTIKSFFRLSGGEKMSAALSIRLAILKALTNVEFAFFDEPTSNLDPSSRNNLSQYINYIRGFSQLFVISHDDSFKRHSEYVIKFSKDNDEITKVECLTNAN